MTWIALYLAVGVAVAVSKQQFSPYPCAAGLCQPTPGPARTILFWPGVLLGGVVA